MWQKRPGQDEGGRALPSPQEGQGQLPLLPRRKREQLRVATCGLRRTEGSRSGEECRPDKTQHVQEWCAKGMFQGCPDTLGSQSNMGDMAPLGPGGGRREVFSPWEGPKDKCPRICAPQRMNRLQMPRASSHDQLHMLLVRLVQTPSIPKHTSCVAPTVRRPRVRLASVAPSHVNVVLKVLVRDFPILRPHSRRTIGPHIQRDRALRPPTVLIGSPSPTHCGSIPASAPSPNVVLQLQVLMRPYPSQQRGDARQLCSTQTTNLHIRTSAILVYSTSVTSLRSDQLKKSCNHENHVPCPHLLNVILRETEACLRLCSPYLSHAGHHVWL